MSQYINIRKSKSKMYDIGDCTICGAKGVVIGSNHKCSSLKKKILISTDLLNTEDVKLCGSYLEHAKNANLRSIPFLLSFTKFKRLMKTKYCFYTGVLLDRSVLENDLYPTIERLNSSLGYTDDNVVVVCKRINSVKSNISIEDIRDIYDGLKRKKLI